MIDEDDLVWLVHEGVWLGIPNDSTGETLQRALMALEWMGRPNES
ncbi:MAG: hypothetical protein RLZZ182_417 [Pseudomonadota bacterium]|jgi:hypothetical protein